MTIHRIRTKADYREAMQRIDMVWNASPKSPEADELEVLSMLVKEYEKTHIRVPEVDPVSVLLHVMEARDLSRRDMEPYIGPRARAPAWPKC